jgi:hypothetical protein
MSDDFGASWISLSDPVARLVARSAGGGQAKVAICEAIAEKRVRIRADSDDSDGYTVGAEIHELNDVDVSGGLNPGRLDWTKSESVALYPWRIRSMPPKGIWRTGHRLHRAER